MTTFKKTDIAFVTGAGSGIGRATCILLAEQGASVVVVDINKSAADQTLVSLTDGDHMSVHCDVASVQDVESAISQVKARYGSPPNIAVNCAGVSLWEPLFDINEEKFNRVFNINVKGTVWVTKTMCRELLSEKKKGSIVNIASVAKQGEGMLAVYGATKGAVESFTLAAAKEMGSHGIRINFVSPGLIDTPMVQVSSKQWMEEHKRRNPMKRSGKPQEVAEAIVFLASEKATYITGSNLYVHGGHI